MANRWHVMKRLARVGMLSFLLASSLGACQKSELVGGPYDGLVRDKANGQPVAGALVMVLWMGVTDSMHSSSPLCYYHEVVKTGADGSFHVEPWKVSTKTGGDPTWLPYIRPLHVQDFVFKSGYRDEFERGGPRNPMKIELVPFDGPVKDRIQFIFEFRDPGCAGDFAKKRIPWAEALADEGAALAEKHNAELSSGDRKLIDGLLFNLDHLKFGQDEAFRRLGERESKREKEIKK